jgi:hypothetical protein
MVKHHKKGTKKRNLEPVNPEDKDLGRFAGSSDEEEHDEEPVDDDDDEMKEDELVETAEKDAGKPRKQRRSRKIQEDKERDVDASGGSDEDSDVEEERMRGTAGMANAMARILGTADPSSTSTKSVVLSKTKTPLQKMAEQEKQQEQAMKEKRRTNRERNLAALHVPLSVATTSTTVNQSSNDLVKELEMERSHRRVATRGVVALFNAIAKHQKKVSDPAPSAADVAKSKTEVKKLTKHGFLDMIKTTAASKQEKGVVAKSEELVTADKSKPQWNALHDDFMLNSKKNWDQESSSEEDSAGGNMDGSSDEEVEKPNAAAKHATPKHGKRRRVGAGR